MVINTDKVEPKKLEGEHPLPVAWNIEQAQSTARPSYEVQAQNKLNEMHLTEKASLSPKDSDTVRKLEASILSGDFKSAENIIHSFKDNPDQAKPLMDVLVKDLQAAGLEASYDVDPASNLPGKTGILNIGTNNGLIPDSRGGFARREREDLAFYTDPASPTFGNHEIPNKWGSVDIQHISPELAFKAVSNQLEINLTGKAI
jgi:hypothetical protein